MSPRRQLWWSQWFLWLIVLTCASFFGGSAARRHGAAATIQAVLVLFQWWLFYQNRVMAQRVEPNGSWHVETKGNLFAFVTHFCFPPKSWKPWGFAMEQLDVPRIRNCPRCGERVDEPLQTLETKRWKDLVTP